MTSMKVIRKLWLDQQHDLMYLAVRSYIFILNYYLEL